MIELGDNSLLALSLDAAVPLWVYRYKKLGGPCSVDYERVREFSDVLASRGDVLQFGGGKKGEVAGLFNQLAEALAVMSFLPGGVEIFGRRWETIQRYKLSSMVLK